MATAPKTCERGIVYRAADTMFTYQGWPSVCIDENGVLYAAASAMRMQHVCPFGKTAMFISRDLGKTWTPPIIINDDYLDDRDAGILYTGSGHMVVSWFSHSAENYRVDRREGILEWIPETALAAAEGMLDSFAKIPEAFGHGGSFVRVSEDYGVTWSEPIQVPVTSPHGPALLRDGTLMYFGKEFLSDNLPNRAEHESVAAYISRDGGYTWEFRGESRRPEGYAASFFCEPTVAELPDGTLLGAIRADSVDESHSLTLYTTRSSDGGASWSEWKCMEVSGAPAQLAVSRSGSVICSYGRREKPMQIRAAVSGDNGLTWGSEYVLDDTISDMGEPYYGTNMGYPATVELPDGSFYTVYYRVCDIDKNRPDRYARCSICSVRWEL